MEEVVKVAKPQWRIIQHLGRSNIPVATGTEEQMHEEFERLRKAGMPGTLEIVDPDGKPVAQALGFVDDAKRRGLGPDGKPYEPTVVEVGHPPRDLRHLADIIKSLPETDPDKDEPGTPYYATTQQQSEEETKRIVERGKRILDQLDREEREEQAKLRDAKFPKEVREAMTAKESDEAKAQRAERVARVAEEMRHASRPQTRVERMASGPCPHSMHASLLSFFVVLQDSISQLQARQREIESVKKRFIIELVLRLAAGAPICGSTVKAAMVDSEPK